MYVKGSLERALESQGMGHFQWFGLFLSTKYGLHAVVTAVEPPNPSTSP